MYHVYIIGSGRNGTLYIGITGDLARRAYQHRMGEVDGFTKRHGVKMLVHVEAFDWIEERSGARKRSRSGRAVGSSRL